MPQVTPFLIKVGKLVTFGAVEGKLALTVIGALTVVGTFSASRFLTPKINMNVNDNDRTRSATLRGTTEPQKRVYGETLVSGPITYAQVAGTDNRHLHQVIALAGHELTSIKKIFFDDQIIDLTDSNIYNATSKLVISGKFGPSNNENNQSENVVLIDTRLGAASQTPYATLRADTLTSQEYLATHTGNGIASIHVRLTIHEGSAELWDEVGNPRNIRALVEGAKVYDPRLEVAAGGTAGASPTNSSYKVFDVNTLGVGTSVNQFARNQQGKNPALIIADLLMDSDFGLGIASSKIDWASVISAADHCDQLVAIPSSATQKRFTASGVVFGSDTHRRSIEKILMAMDGDLLYSQGKYIIKAGAYEAPTESFTENDVVSAVEVKTSTPRQDRYNQVSGLFIDPDENYKLMEFGPVTVSGAIARDNGEVLPEEIKLPFTDNHFVAQRLAFKKVKQSFAQTMMQVTLNLKGMRVRVGDRINLTLPELNTVDSGNWSPKVFKVIAWNFAEDGGGIDLTLVEDEAGFYDDPAESDYSTVNAQGQITTSLPDVAAPTNFVATSQINAIKLDWVNPPNAATWEQIWIFRSTNATTPTDSSTPITRLRTTSFIDQRDADGTEYYYWIQAVKYPNGSTPTSGNTNSAKSVMVALGTPTSGKIAATKIGQTVMDDDSVGSAQIIDGNVGSSQIATTIQSDNYSSSGGASGWQINRSGSAFFRTATITATIQGGSIQGLQPSGSSLTSIPTNIFTRTSSKNIPTGTESGAFMDLASGAFVFGNAATFLSFANNTDVTPNAFELDVKGVLSPTVLDLSAVTDVTVMPSTIKAQGYVPASIPPTALSDEVWNQIDGLIGQAGTGFYVSASGVYLGEAQKIINLGSTPDHRKGDITVQVVVADSFSADVDFAAGSDPLKLNITLQYKLASASDYSNAVTISTTSGGAAGAAQKPANPKQVLSGTVYSINESITVTLTSGAGQDIADDVDLDFRVILERVGSQSAFATVANGGANDTDGTPVTLQVSEGAAGIVATSGNADTLDTIDSTGFLRLGTSGSTIDNNAFGNQTFTGDVTVTGTLNLQGSIDQYNVTDLEVVDKTISLNSGNTQSLSNGAGIKIDRGSATDASILWDESNDEFDFSHSINLGGKSLSEVQQVLGTEGSGWLEFNEDDDNVWFTGTRDNITVLGSVTDIVFAGDSNANGTGGIFYFGYGQAKDGGGTFTQTAKLDRDGDLKIAGQLQHDSSLTLNAAGAINLDADNSGNVFLKDNNVTYGRLHKSNDNFVVKNVIYDGKILFQGADSNGTELTPFTLDMSLGGRALFSSGTAVTNPNILTIRTNAEANTTAGDVYAGLEFAVQGAENSTGSISGGVVSAIKAIDYRPNSTSFDDAGIGFYTLNTDESVATFRGGFSNQGGLFVSVDGNVDRNTGQGDIYADNNIEAGNNLSFNGQLKRGSTVIMNAGSGTLFNIHTISVPDSDFVVQDGTNTNETPSAETNIIWRDHSESRLYLGTTRDLVEFRGDVNFQSGHTLSHDGNVILDASRNLSNITKAEINASGTETSGQIRLHVGALNHTQSSAIAQFGGFIRAAQFFFLHASAGSADALKIDYVGDDMDVTQGEGDYNGGLRANAYRIGSGGTTVIDSSRNLLNIGSISATGPVTIALNASRQLKVDFDTEGDSRTSLRSVEGTANNLRPIQIEGQEIVLSTAAFNQTASVERVRVSDTGAVVFSGGFTTGSGVTIGGGLTSSTITVNSQDSTNEGGEILLKGAGTNLDLRIDNFAGGFRVFDSASTPLVRLRLDNSGNATIAGRVVASNGTTTKAAYGFASSATTGISYSSTNNRVNILSGGAVKAYVQTGSSNPEVETMYVDGIIQANGKVTWTGGSSTLANTAYTYSQVGHLPLAGGTMTGNLTLDSANPILDLVADANADATIRLRETGTGIVGTELVYDGGSNEFFLKIGNNPTSTALTIDRDTKAAQFSGSVGINCSPSAPLEVSATGMTSVDIAHFSNSNNVVKAKFSLSSNGSGKLDLIEGNNATTISLDSTNGSITATGSISSGSFTTSGNIDFTADTALLRNQQDDSGQIGIQVRNSSGSAKEVRWDAANNSNGAWRPTGNGASDLGLTNKIWNNLFVNTIKMGTGNVEVIDSSRNGSFNNISATSLSLSGAFTPSSVTTTGNVSAAQFRASYGSVNAPAFTFKNDDDTGMWSAGGDVKFAVGGSNRMTIGASATTVSGRISVVGDVQAGSVPQTIITTGRALQNVTSVTSTGNITGVNFSASGSATIGSNLTVSNGELSVTRTGDNFPTFEMARTGGSSKTNQQWDQQIGSTGNWNLKAVTGTVYFPIICTPIGDVNLACSTSGTNPVVAIDQSLSRTTFAGGIRVNHSENNGILVTASDTNADQSFNAMKIDYNVSGSQTTTADRSHIGLNIDVDSSATGGDTSDEHRVYGIYNDTRVTGDSDLVYGTFSQARTDNFATGTVTHLRGLLGQSSAHHNAGQVTNNVGIYGYGLNQTDGTGLVTHTYGGYLHALAGSSSSQTSDSYSACFAFMQVNTAQTSNISQIHGLRAEVQLDNDTATDHDVTISNAYVVRATFDENDVDNTYTVNNGYLFFGDYQGQTPTNAFGVYIADDVESRFLGRVRAKEFDVGGTLVIDASRNLVNILGLYGNGGTLNHYNTNHVFKSTTSNLQAHLTDTGLGIGTSPSNAVLETVSSTGGGAPVFRAGSADFLGVQIGTQGGGFSVESNNYFAIWHQPYANKGTQNNLTERLRVDVSGNLLVSGTEPNPAQNNTTDAISLHNVGLLRASTTNAAAPLDLNVKSRNGYIATFRKDGTLVGAVGVDSGDNLYIASTTANHSGLYLSTNVYAPLRAGSLLDDAISIGNSAYRYKDLQLSGTAYAGELIIGQNSGLSGTQVYIKKKDNSTNLQRWGEGTSGASTYRFRIDQNFAFIANNGTSDLLTISSSNGSITTSGNITTTGKLGVGASPTEPLTVSKTASGSTTQIASFVNPVGTASTGVRLWLSGTNTTTRGAFIDAVAESTANNHTLRFGVSDSGSAPVERARLDHDGNFIVGKQVNNTFNEGFVAKAAGGANITSAGGTTLELNRRTSDGTVLNFRKDNSTYGSVGVINGDNLRIGGSVADHGGLQFALHEIVPMEANVDSDGTINLGSANSRFQDLHLSGTAHASKLKIEPNGTIELEDQNGVNRGFLQAFSSAPHFRISTSGQESIGIYDGTTENIRINGSGDFNLRTGVLEINSTTVLDQSRNLTNISSITAAGVLQVTNSSGSNGTNTSQYAVIGLASGGAQATIGSQHNGDGYANLNLGSVVSGDRKMWHISKRVNSLSNRLEFFWYESGGFNSRFQFSTGGNFTATGNIIGAGINSTATFTELGATSGSSLIFKRNNASYIQADQTGGYFIFITSGRSTSYANRALAITTDNHLKAGGHVDAVSGFLVNGTTVIDNGRNLLSIGSISASTITTSGDITVNGNQVFMNASNARVKFAVWSNTTYGIGMTNGVSFGGIGLGSSDYAMTFQMNNTAARGFLWLDHDDTLAQGAMALTTQGLLTVAGATRIGFGKNDTTTPASSTAMLDVNGDIQLGSATSNARLFIRKADDNQPDHINIFCGSTQTGQIGSQDTTWLRINQTVNKNIYTPRYIRADNGFRVDGTAMGIDGSGRFRAFAGSTSSVGIGFANDIDTGFYSPAANTIDVVTAGDAHARFDSTGNFIVEGNVTAFGSVSDIRLKEGIQRIADPVSKVQQLDGVTFQYKKTGAKSTGLIAQQLLKVLPEVVYQETDIQSGEKHYAVRYGPVVGLLVEAIKEQQQQIDSLKDIIKEMTDGNHEHD